MPFKRILVAFDGSEQSAKAFNAATNLAKELKSKLAIVNVLDPDFAIENPDAGMVRELILKDMREDQKKLIEQILENPLNEEPTIYTAEGNPYKEILIAAESFKADIILLGTHGRTGLSRLLMGSVAEQVIRHSKKPVLVYPHIER